jgi:hypothetical protein
MRGTPSRSPRGGEGGDRVLVFDVQLVLFFRGDAVQRAAAGYAVGVTAWRAVEEL